MNSLNNSIKYSFSNAVPVKYALEHFSALSFPNLRTRIINNRIKNPLYAVMAKREDEIIALALGSRERKSTSDILTLLVKPDYRRQGIGTKVIQQMNKLQAQQGHQQCRIFYFNDWEDNRFIDYLSKKQFWTNPKTSLYRFEHHYERNKHQILPSGLKLDESYQFKRWSNLSVQERNEHFQHYDNRHDIKKMFLISNYTQRMIPELTHVLFKTGETIGWCIGLKSSQNSVEHTLFLLPEHRSSPLIPIALISRNWIAQMKSQYKKAVWLIDANNGSMLRFMKAKLPHLVHKESSLNMISKNISQA